MNTVYIINFILGGKNESCYSCWWIRDKDWEETHLKPKPMIEIGTKPILWHIMSLYSHYGITEFIICLGYKGYAIKEFFLNYNLHMSDFTIHLSDNTITSHSQRRTVESYTNRYWCNYRNGGRVKRIQNFVGDEPFCLTYGDGLSNVNIKELIAFHKTWKNGNCYRRTTSW